MPKATTKVVKPAASALAGLSPLLTAAAAPHRAYLASLGVPPVWVTMAEIFTAIFAVVFFLSKTCLTKSITKRSPSVGTRGAAHIYASGSWLADAQTNPSKHHAEVFILKYSVCWILSVGVVIATAAYESWSKWGYMTYCGTCAAPALLYPLMRPLKGDVGRPLRDWYILKANLWIAIFSFIGNYWYTHYFYGVLKANYTFQAHRLNDVPIAMYLMTHAYFMFYHVLSNAVLRKIRGKYQADAGRFIYQCGVVAAMSYSTAFMESLTICGFPYYVFEDRDMAYTLGSAFYGIYFLVSFPMFLRVDEDVRADGKGLSKVVAAALPAGAVEAMGGRMTHHSVFWEAMGSGMSVLCMLDFVRLYLGLDFKMLAGGH